MNLTAVVATLMKQWRLLTAQMMPIVVLKVPLRKSLTFESQLCLGAVEVDVGDGCCEGVDDENDRLLRFRDLHFDKNMSLKTTKHIVNPYSNRQTVIH